MWQRTESIADNRNSDGCWLTQAESSLFLDNPYRRNLCRVCPHRLKRLDPGKADAPARTCDIRSLRAADSMSRASSLLSGRPGSSTALEWANLPRARHLTVVRCGKTKGTPRGEGRSSCVLRKLQQDTRSGTRCVGGGPVGRNEAREAWHLESEHAIPVLEKF